jgi:uncharacterized repeat protein (TIGR03803 family)
MKTFSVAKKAYILFAFCAATAIVTPAQTFTTLHSFDRTDGNNPIAGLTQGINGSMYGSTLRGGAYNAGTVFSISANRTVTTLYNFCSEEDCADGVGPIAALTEDVQGNFYGTTNSGSSENWGTVFKITPVGVLTTLHSFCLQSGCPDGQLPSGLVLAADGNFYGITSTGGAHSWGTFFKITPSGDLTTLYSFNSGNGSPISVIQAANGNFYGTSVVGGTEDCGTIFAITPTGVLTTLHSFAGTDGRNPHAGLIQGVDGNFYGTTAAGGTYTGSFCDYGCGTVFRIAPDGELTTLHSFDLTDGAYPYAELIQSTDGNFYGTTTSGGAGDEINGYGTVFMITPSGTLTTLHSFDKKDGTAPHDLAQRTDGSLYGTTYAGGASRHGTIFRLSVGLGPLARTIPASGTVGSSVTILGTDLTGSTKVTFHGIAATFTVVSASEITTSVPTGATTGTVKVVTPSGTLSSNVPFTVN